MQDLGSKTKASLIWNISLKAVFQVFRFGISIIIARLLDPKDFGIMGLASILILYADNLTSLGFNQALVHKKEINENHINSVFTVNFSLSVFLTVVIILLSGQIADFFHVPELRKVLLLLSCVFIISTFYQIPMTLMRRQLNFRVVALTELFRGILQACITLSLAMLGLKYWALVIGFISSYILSLIYISIKVEWKPAIRYNHLAIKDIFSFGFWNFIRMQISQLNEFTDKFIVGKALGPVLLGYYDKAFSTVALQKGSFTTQINSVMFSSFSRLQSEKGDKAKKYLKKTLSVASLVTFPINIGVLAIGEYFVLVLLGPKWEPMIYPLKVFSVAFLFSTISDLCSSFNIGMGSYIKQTVIEGCCNIIMILTCLVAANYGIRFIVLGVSFVYAMNSFATYQLTRKTIDMKWADLIESILPGAIGSIIMLLFIELAKKFIFSEVNIGNFIFMLIIGAVTYISAIAIPQYPILEEYRSAVIIGIKNMFCKTVAEKTD